MGKKTLRDVEVRGKRVLVRVDFNVPLHPQTREVTDDSRLRACSNTIQHLRYYGAKVILCSHLGRPEGKVVEELRIEPVAERLSRIIHRPVPTAPDCVGPAAGAAVAPARGGGGGAP